MEKQTKRIASVTVLAWLSLVPLVYAAGDAKIFPGTSCRPENPESVVPYTNGILNEGDAVETVFCPIVRDNHTNLNGVVTGAVKLQSFSGAAISCTLYSFDQYGIEKDSETIPTSGNAPQMLVFYKVDISAVNGFYTFICELPPDAAIYSYAIHEP
jgi:hypothetical protein